MRSAAVQSASIPMLCHTSRLQTAIPFILALIYSSRTKPTTGKNERLAKTSEKTKCGSAVFTDSYVCILNETPGGAFNVIGNGQKYTGGDTLFVYNIDGSFIKELSLKDLYKKNSKIEHISLLFCSGNDIYFLVDASTWNDPINGIASPNTNLILCCADIYPAS